MQTATNQTTKVGDFIFVKMLGKGTSANVHQVYDIKKRTIVAAKQIPISKILGQREHERFKRECFILKKLSHQNIIKLIKVDKDKTFYYLFLEYCNGCNLYEYKTFYEQKYHKQLNELYVQKILRQLIQGLEYMHNNNVIHRDIKLDNILLNFNAFPNVVDSNNQCKDIDLNVVSLNDDFTIKIADLGFAREINSGTAGTICGTPITMSPEIILNNNNKSYNSKADLWSLGAITYELLVGQVPFFATSIAELKKQIAEGKYSLPKQLKLSMEAISFINGLLQFYPDKRMTWEQIKQHPFITKDAKDFKIIKLTNETTNDNIELNCKTCDNYLWLNYKNETFNVDVDKVNQEIMKNKEILEEIQKKQTINEDLLKAIEDEKKKLEIEKTKLKEETEKAEKIKQQVEQTLKQAEEAKKKAEEEKRIASEEAERLREKTKQELEEIRRKRVQLEEIEKERIEKQKLENQKFQEEKKELLNKLKEEERKLEQKRLENLKAKEQNEAMLRNAQRLKEEAERKVEEILNERELNQLNKEETEKYLKAEEEKRQIELQIKEQKQKEIIDKLKEQSEELEKLKEISKELQKQLLEKDKLQQELEKKQNEKDCLIEKMKAITDEKERKIVQIEHDKREQEFLLLQEKQKFQQQLEEKDKVIQANILKAQEVIQELKRNENENKIDNDWEKFASFENDFQIDELCTHYEVLNEYF